MRAADKFQTSTPTVRCISRRRGRLPGLIAFALAAIALAAWPSASAARPHPSIRGIPHGVKAACAVPVGPKRARCYARIITRPSSSVPLASSSAPVTAYSPSQIAHGYAFDALSCGSTCGQGETIAVVDAYDAPNVESDLGAFDTQYGLPACTTANGCFKKVTPGGSTPAYDAGWEQEISLDVQWAHAMAPGAKIVLEEAADDTVVNLYGAVDDAVNNQHANVVSMSWGGSEYSGEGSDDTAHFNKSGTTFIASTGDSGRQSDYPAASPFVTAVGGTTLNLDTAGNRVSAETAWSGTGGYSSPYEAEPGYQTSFTNVSGAPSIGTVTGNKRGYGDVSYDADPNTGVAVYDYDAGGWLQIGGTSAGAPQWAALVAITKGGNTSQVDNHNIYNSAAGSSYAANYHDVTSGQNGTCGIACTAAAGWDEPTGLGTPIANTLTSALRPNDFSISSSPSSLSLTQNTSRTSTISTAVTSGSAATVNLSGSGAPPGATATLNPSSVTAGQSSTLTVNAGTAAPGSYTITVTGSEGSTTHTTNIAVTISTGAVTAVTGAGNNMYVQAPQLPSGWQNLGGNLLGAPAVAAVPQSSGYASPLFVGVGSDHSLWIRSIATGWQMLAYAYCLDNPAASVSGSTLYVACEGSDHALWYGTTTLPTSSLPSLSAMYSLGGVLSAGPAVAPVGGTMTFFVSGSDQNLWTRTLSAGWSGYSFPCYGHPAAGVAQGGSTTYAACNSSGSSLYVMTNGGSGWSPEKYYGGVMTDGPGMAVTSSGSFFWVEAFDGSLWATEAPNAWSPAGISGIQHGAGAVGIG